jgi:hypothetical protein
MGRRLACKNRAPAGREKKERKVPLRMGARAPLTYSKLTRQRSPIPAGGWLNPMKTVNFANFGSDVPAARSKTGTFRAQTLP